MSFYEKAYHVMDKHPRRVVFGWCAFMLSLLAVHGCDVSPPIVRQNPVIAPGHPLRTVCAETDGMIRCENSEIICYEHYRSGVWCHWKEEPKRNTK